MLDTPILLPKFVKTSTDSPLLKIQEDTSKEPVLLVKKLKNHIKHEFNHTLAKTQAKDIDLTKSVKIIRLDGMSCSIDFSKNKSRTLNAKGFLGRKISKQAKRFYKPTISPQFHHCFTKSLTPDLHRKINIEVPRIDLQEYFMLKGIQTTPIQITPNIQSARSNKKIVFYDKRPATTTLNSQRGSPSPRASSPVFFQMNEMHDYISRTFAKKMEEKKKRVHRLNTADGQKRPFNKNLLFSTPRSVNSMEETRKHSKMKSLYVQNAIIRSNQENKTLGNGLAGIAIIGEHLNTMDYSHFKNMMNTLPAK